MPTPSVYNPLIRLTKMFSSLVCYRSVPGLEESAVLGSSRLVASTIMLSALLSGVAMHQVHAQNNAPIFNWQGEVQVSTSTLTIREGETLSYNIRLSEQPAADGWWVRIHVNGVVYYAGNHDNSEGIGIRWVPSVGWEFNQDRDPVDNPGPTQWRNVHITAFQDDDDKDEFVTITHEVWDEKSNCPPSLHGVAPVEVQVTDDETASTGVALSVNPMTVSEGAGGTTVTVRAALNGAARLGSTPVKVAVGKAGDSATEGTDYETVDDLTVTIPEGLTSATERFTLTPTDDVVVESDKTVTVSGTTAASGITTVNPATLTITDDDVPPDTIELRVSPDSVAENAGATGIMVTAAFPQGSATLSTPTVVNVTLAAATAQTADFTPVQPFNLTIPASARSGTATFQFTPNDDTSMEGSETVTVSGTTSGITTINPATLTIIDNDAPPDTIELSVNPDSVAENAGATGIMVTAAFPQGSAILSTPTVVNVTLTAATAQTADFTPVQPFNLTIPASARSGTATFQFTPNDDTSMEGSETVTVSGTTSGITTINPATLTIIDDDTPNNPPTGQPRITGTARVGQTLTAVTTDIQDADGLGDFAYQWKADGTNIAGAMDSSYRLTNNEVGKRITVTVSFTDGIGTEETVTSLPTDAVREAVTPPPPPPPPVLTVAFDLASYSTTEGGDPVTLRVTLNRTSNQNLTIPITVMPQGATEADDYTVSGLTDGTLSFAPGDLSKTFMIVANEDTDSDDETIELGFGTLLEGVSQGVMATATLTIIDDDAPPDTIELKVSPSRVAENAGATGIMVTAAFPQGSAILSTPTVVNVTLTAATAQTADFTPVQPFNLTIPASARSGTATFQFTPNDDTSMEGSETVTVSGTTTVSGITTINPATLTITDDDTPNNPPTGQPRITGTPQVGQTLTAVTTDIQDADGLGNFVYQWKADGTNIAGAMDSSYRLTNNEVGKRITVTVSFTDGIGTEETVTSQPTAAVRDAVTPLVLTVAFDLASYSTTEGGDPVTLRVTLNRTSNQDLTIPITVMPQGATEADDYTVSGLTDGTLSFAPGDLSKTFMIVANEDTDSDDETIELGFGTLLEGVSKGEMATATLTITDDDVPPDTIELKVSPSSVAENAGETDIMVTAAFPQGSATLSTPTVVNVTLAAATAQTADFTPVQPFNVTIPASAGSGTATFQFTPNDDTSMEGSETATVSGTTTVSGITTINPATLTITDDDTPNNPPTGQPRITGTPQVGQTLTAVTTDIQDADGLGDFVYQWKADGTNIAGAMDSSYRLTNNEVGKRITVTVSFTDGIGTEETVTSQPTAAVRDAVTPPVLTVAFDLASYSTTEGGDPVTLRVTLNRTSNQDLTIPITVMPQGATEADDYTVSGLTDGALSFAPGDLMRSKTFMIVANEDTDSDNETIELGFGTLPEGVSKGEMATATLTITDTGPPELTVSFARAEYTIAEGGEPSSINVNISPAADRRVEVPLVVTTQGGATSQDYDGVPASIVFEVGATVVTFQVTASADQEDDPGKSIVLGFGDLPEAVSEGDPSETTVKFTQQRSAKQFSASMKILLAVTARSVADSAQTAIQSRFQRKRQLMRNRQSARGPNTGGSLSAGLAGSNGSGLSRAGALNHMPEVDRFGFAPPRLAEGAGPSMGSTRSGSLHNSLAPDYGIAPTQEAYGYDTLQRTSTAEPSLGALQFSGIRARQPVLSQASFNLQMGESPRGNDGSGSVALWVQGDLQDFNGNITRGGIDYRGVMGAVHVGLDLYNSEQMLVGFSFMRSFARINYNADGVHGMFRNGMNTAHPYLYWQPNERFSAWVIGGLGRGEVDVNEPGRAHDLTSDFRMFLGGMRSVLAKRGNTEVGVVVDSFTARLGTNASKDIERVSGQVSRTRMMLEMVHDKPLEAGRSLSIKAEFGHRYDAGDADRGSGAEAGFRLGYLNAAGGLDIAWHGRMLLVRESDYRDFGVGMQVSWDSGEKHRGLQLSMMSSRGHDGGGRTTLWNNSALVIRPMGSGYMPNASQTSTSSEVAYGMDIFGGWGLLTPYSRLQLAGYGRDLRVGTELSLLSRGLRWQPAKFQLEGIRRETPNRMIDLGMMLGISIPF